MDGSLVNTCQHGFDFRSIDNGSTIATDGSRHTPENAGDCGCKRERRPGEHKGRHSPRNQIQQTACVFDFGLGADTHEDGAVFSDARDQLLLACAMSPASLGYRRIQRSTSLTSTSKASGHATSISLISTHPRSALVPPYATPVTQCRPKIRIREVSAGTKEHHTLLQYPPW